MKKTLLILLTITLSFSLFGCSSDDGYEHDVPKEIVVSLQDLPYIDYLSVKNPVVTITVKDIGEIKLQLFRNIAPETVNSFILYIQEEAYNDNEFARTVANVLIQGGHLPDEECRIFGEMTNNGFDNPVEFDRGIIGMARLTGLYNSQISSFFIMNSKQPSFDDEYTAFGGVISGFNVLDYIASLELSDTETPITKITIESITVELNGYETTDRVCNTDQY